MAITKRHIGFGHWVIEQDGERIAGPMTKVEADAQAEALASRVSPPPAARPGLLSDREWQRKISADINRPIAATLAGIRAVLVQYGRSEDEIRFFLPRWEVDLKQGLQAARRERKIVPLPRPAAAPTAA